MRVFHGVSGSSKGPLIYSAWRSWVIQHRSKAFLPHCLSVAATAIAKGATDKGPKGFARRGLSGMQICNRCEWSQKTQLSRSGGAAITAASRAITACSDATDLPAGISLAGWHTTCRQKYHLPADLTVARWPGACRLAYPMPADLPNSPAVPFPPTLMPGCPSWLALELASSL